MGVAELSGVLGVLHVYRWLRWVFANAIFVTAVAGDVCEVLGPVLAVVGKVLDEVVDVPFAHDLGAGVALS